MQHQLLPSITRASKIEPPPSRPVIVLLRRYNHGLLINIPAWSSKMTAKFSPLPPVLPIALANVTQASPSVQSRSGVISDILELVELLCRLSLIQPKRQASGNWFRVSLLKILPVGSSLVRLVFAKLEYMKSMASSMVPGAT